MTVTVETAEDCLRHCETKLGDLEYQLAIRKIELLVAQARGKAIDEIRLLFINTITAPLHESELQ